MVMTHRFIGGEFGPRELQALAAFQRKVAVVPTEFAAWRELAPSAACRI